MSIQSQITRIENAKADIISAIGEKGVEAPADCLIDAVADLIRLISVGAGLNVDVVGGTTQPTSAEENTLWINTDVAITSWMFSTTEPENIDAGTVWIHTVAQGGTEINVIEENGIYLRINACKQWDGTAFVDKTGYLFIDNQWVELLKIPLYIYSEGTSDTGFQQYSIGSNYKNSEATYNGTTTWRFATQATKNVTAAIRSSETLELTGYKTLKALVYAIKGYGDAASATPNISLFVTDEASQNLNSSNAAYDTIILSYRVQSTFAAWSELQLDITDITGSHYVGIGLGNTTAGAQQMYVKALWLE